jgi:hypothetical protein
MEEDELHKIYEAVAALSRRVAELDQKNSELAGAINTIATSMGGPQQSDSMVLDQETTIVDPYNIASHKNFSLPSGGVIKIKSKSLCTNGLHVVEDQSKIIFCSKCSSIICVDHRYDLDDNICTNCLKKELDGFDRLDIYLLYAIYNDTPLKDFRKRFKLPLRDVSSAVSKLVSHGCIEKDIVFRRFLTPYGINVLKLGACLYGLDSSSGDEYESTAK